MSFFGAGLNKALQAARIEKAASQLLTEASKDNGAFDGRSARSLKRAGTKLAGWNADGKNAATLRRLQTQLDGLCPKVDTADGQRAACNALFKPAPKKDSVAAAA